MHPYIHIYQHVLIQMCVHPIPKISINVAELQSQNFFIQSVAIINLKLDITMEIKCYSYYSKMFSL